MAARRSSAFSERATPWRRLRSPSPRRGESPRNFPKGHSGKRAASRQRCVSQGGGGGGTGTEIFPVSTSADSRSSRPTAGVTGLTVTVMTPFNEQGRPEAPSFYPSCIRSRARLPYDAVHAYLTRQEERGKGRTIPVEIGEMLRRMETFAGRLTLARADRGALDFDLSEAKIVVREEIPREVTAAPRWESHRLIEEFMVLAHTAVAEFLSSRGIPLPLRRHHAPAAGR